MLKKIFITLTLSASLISAQSAGNSGVAFLKLGTGARNIAMSDLGVISGSELTSIQYNPAQLSVLRLTQLSFSHNSLFQDLSSEIFSASIVAFGLPFALNVNTTSISDIEIRNIPGDPISKFNANYFSAGLSTAFNVIENLHAGVTFRYIYENLYSDEASGYGFDLGVLYSGLINNLSVGASLRNIGSMSMMRNESTKQPIDFRAGASYSIDFGQSKIKMNAIGGIQKYLDDESLHLHVGTELVYDDAFFVRGGYLTGSDSKNISAGFGLKWKGLNIDYAYVPVKYGLGDNNIITFIYTF
ncbi:MAG TPA: PorV/PorQ family protein [Melioribacteraceae bacterium]|nr:PorV/PorQ family protein [Melioribacteraceae bacterium]